MARFRKGLWYKVKFLDHAVGIDRAVTCKIYGWVVSQDKVSVVLSSWECEDVELKPDNTELITLIKSTVLEAQQVE